MRGRPFSGFLAEPDVAAYSFQLQVAVPAEDLRCGGSVHDLRRIQCRVESVLALAIELCTRLQPLGWHLLSVRFDEEVCVVLSRNGTAELVAQDLTNLPTALVALIGHDLHICATAGDHVFELAFSDGHLRPLSEMDTN